MDLRVPVDLPPFPRHYIENHGRDSLLLQDPHHENYGLETRTLGDSETLRQDTRRREREERKAIAALWASSRRDEKPLILGPKPATTPR